jgi:hypothetical protein
MPTNQIHLAEHKRNIFWEQPKAGVSIDEVLKSEYWVHVADQIGRACAMRPGSKIEICPEDGAYHAVLYIKSLSRPGPNRLAEIRVELLDYYEFNKVAAKPEEYWVKHRGRARWCVMKGDDPVETGYETIELAQEALAIHAKRMAA